MDREFTHPDELIPVESITGQEFTDCSAETTSDSALDSGSRPTFETVARSGKSRATKGL